MELDQPLQKSSTLFSISKWLWDYKQWIISILVITTLIFIGVSESIKEHNPTKFLENFGGRLISADTVAGKEFTKLTENGLRQSNYVEYKSLSWTENFVQKSSALANNIEEFTKTAYSRFKAFWLLFCNLYFIWMMFMLFYKLFELKNHDDNVANVLFALITICALQIFYKATLLFTLSNQMKAIIYSIGFIFVFGGIFLLFLTDARFIIASIILTIIIVGTCAGIFITKSTTNERAKEIADTFILFQGTWKIVRFIPSLFTGKVTNYILNANYLPNATFK